MKLTKSFPTSAWRPESMTYTCAVFPTLESTLEEAQFEKYDLVARKLNLQPGQRLLDVGCGWGGMARHAAKHYGVKVIGVTLSQEQAIWAQDEIKRQGLDHLAEVRFMDYRDVTESGFDAISSIGLTEHIGVRNYPSYFTFMRDHVKVGGRILNHCITRPHNKTMSTGAFIDRYVFPDGELTGVGRITTAAQDVGLEVRHVENLREHYAMTLRGWRNVKEGGAKGDAPLKETLAAAMIAATGWDPQGEAPLPLYDPCCGSGTVLIEAAQMACRIAPGLQRHFAFEKLLPFQAHVWSAIKEEANSAITTCATGIFGSDISHRMVDFAEHNAERAGVAQAVQLRGGDALQRMPPCEGHWTVLLNG